MAVAARTIADRLTFAYILLARAGSLLATESALALTLTIVRCRAALAGALVSILAAVDALDLRFDSGLAAVDSVSAKWADGSSPTCGYSSAILAFSPL